MKIWATRIRALIPKRKEKPSLSHPLQLHPPVLPFPPFPATSCLSITPSISSELSFGVVFGPIFFFFLLFFAKNSCFQPIRMRGLSLLFPKEEKSQTVGPRNRRWNLQPPSPVVVSAGRIRPLERRSNIGENGHEMFWAFGFFEGRISKGWELALREIWGDVEWGRG